MMANGMLAGLVAITAPCAFVQPWAAAVIGIIAGVLVIESVVLHRAQAAVDDPVGAIAVHGVVRHLRRARASASSPTASTAPGWNGTERASATRASTGSSTAASGWGQLGAQAHRRGRDLDRDLRHRLRASSRSRTRS